MGPDTAGFHPFIVWMQSFSQQGSWFFNQVVVCPAQRTALFKAHVSLFVQGRRVDGPAAEAHFSVQRWLFDCATCRLRESLLWLGRWMRRPSQRRL